MSPSGSSVSQMILIGRPRIIPECGPEAQERDVVPPSNRPPMGQTPRRSDPLSARHPVGQGDFAETDSILNQIIVSSPLEVLYCNDPPKPRLGSPAHTFPY
ncbi:unnamed protein product, partial [Cuscuta europaea]